MPPAWSIGPAGVQKLNAQGQVRLKECISQSANTGTRYVWDWDRGLTPAKAYRRPEAIRMKSWLAHDRT